jgi:phosphoribosyl 1,2-cyclic phosphodiesterase
VSCNGITAGVFTDIGIVCDNLISHFKQCHAVFLESNYDEDMLENGRYPVHLKNRIRGGQGHLSNRQALDLFIQHRPPFMSHVFLSHLSKENNDPGLAAGLFAQHAGEVKVVVASRYAATEVYAIAGNTIAQPLKPPGKPQQLGLFAEI